MHTIANAPNRFKLLAAGIALSAFVITLLAVVFAAGPARAEVSGVIPKPCGPGQDNFPEDPAAEKSSGHYAIFDAYWLPAEGLDGGAKDGTLNNNLCPPAAKHTDKTVKGETIEVTTLSPTDIDLRTTIIHVDNTHLADVVATNDEAGTTKLSLKKYTGVDRALGLGEDDPVPDGTQVYWLRLEDPDRDLPPSSLVMGFSAGQLDATYWEHQDEDGNKLSDYAFQYELEAVRYHGPHASKLPQVLTYWEPELGSGLVWNSLDTDVNTMPLGAGEYEHLEWVFTHPGTYVLEVHLKGHVRQVEPDDAGDDWKPITDKETTVTSEVREYTFQVGPLTVNESPAFGVAWSVTENSVGGTKVGDPITVFANDDDALHYSLTGAGADKFNVVSVSGGAQIEVGDGAVLDYEAKQSYDLVLGVSDGKDHENNPERDSTVDDTIVVRVGLVDISPHIVVHGVPETDPRAGHALTIRGSLAEVQGYVPGTAQWEFQFLHSDRTLDFTNAMTLQDNGDGVFELQANGLGTHYYRLRCQYQFQDASGRTKYHSMPPVDFSVNWLPASG